MLFRSGNVHIEIRCRSLHRGVDYPAVKLAGDEIRIAADYKLVVKAGGIQLVRPESDVQLDLLRGGKVVGGIAQAAQKGFLQRKFNAMLKTKVPDEPSQGFNLQGRWGQAGKLAVRETKSADGWLVLGLAQVAHAALVAGLDSQATEPVDPPEIANQTAVRLTASETTGIE